MGGVRNSVFCPSVYRLGGKLWEIPGWRGYLPMWQSSRGVVLACSLCIAVNSKPCIAILAKFILLTHQPVVRQNCLGLAIASVIAVGVFLLQKKSLSRWRVWRKVIIHAIPAASCCTNIQPANEACAAKGWFGSFGNLDLCIADPCSCCRLMNCSSLSTLALSAAVQGRSIKTEIFAK